MKKKTFSLLLSMTLLMFTTTVFHASQQPDVFIRDGTVMAPLRSLAEGAGAAVFWNGDDKSAFITAGKTAIQVTAGSRDMIVNGEGTQMRTTAVIYRDRLYLPLRQISEALGGTVSWDAAQKTAVVSISGIKTAYAVNTFLDTISGNQEQEPDACAGNAMIALTFDDGPSEFTSGILDILKAYDARATFFVLGCSAAQYPETMRRIIREGSEIGNHSFDHTDFTALSLSGLNYQINRTQSLIFDITSVKPVLYRPPYGRYNAFVIRNIDMAAVLWNVDPEDWKHDDVSGIVSGVLDKARDGRIVIMHDTNIFTLKAMETVIPALVKRGFRLVTVSGMMEAKGLEITPGRIYFSAHEVRDN